MTVHRVRSVGSHSEGVTLEDVMTEVQRIAQLLENLDIKMDKLEKSTQETRTEISDLRDQLDQ